MLPRLPPLQPAALPLVSRVSASLTHGSEFNLRVATGVHTSCLQPPSLLSAWKSESLHLPWKGIRRDPYSVLWVLTPLLRAPPPFAGSLPMALVTFLFPNNPFQSLSQTRIEDLFPSSHECRRVWQLPAIPDISRTGFK